MIEIYNVVEKMEGKPSQEFTDNHTVKFHLNKKESIEIRIVDGMLDVRKHYDGTDFYKCRPRITPESSNVIHIK